MDLSIKISDRRIAQLLVSAFESGTSYWCRIMDTKEPKVQRMVLDEGDEGGKIWPYYDYPLTGGAVICRIDDGDTEDTDESFKPLTLDLAAIERGLKLMAEKHPQHFGDFLAENDDAFTGDVFLQCCLLGALVYG